MATTAEVQNLKNYLEGYSYDYLQEYAERNMLASEGMTKSQLIDSIANLLASAGYGVSIVKKRDASKIAEKPMSPRSPRSRRSRSPRMSTGSFSGSEQSTDTESSRMPMDSMKTTRYYMPGTHQVSRQKIMNALKDGIDITELEFHADAQLPEINGYYTWGNQFGKGYMKPAGRRSMSPSKRQYNTQDVLDSEGNVDANKLMTWIGEGGDPTELYFPPDTELVDLSAYGYDYNMWGNKYGKGYMVPAGRS
jgi:hypothetical protein